MSRDSKNDGYIYQALNYYNLDEDIDIDEEERPDNITSKRIKKLINKKIRASKPKYKGIMIAGIGVFIVVNIILVSIGGEQVYATIGKTIMSSIAKLRGDTAEYDKYSNSINASVTDKGIKFVINEVVSDGNILAVSYSIISEGNLKDIKGVISGNGEAEINSWPSINGKRFSGLSRSGKLVSENRYEGCDFIDDTNGIIPKGDFYLDIMVRYIGEIEGNWDIKVKVDRDKIMKEVKEYKINRNIKVSDDVILTFKKIITSPISVGIKAAPNYGKYNYMLLDDKGNQLDWKNNSIADGNMSMEYSGLLSKDTKSLTFVPFVFNDKYRPKFDDVHSLEKLPIKIDQGKYGSITVNKAEWTEDNKFKISYEANSKYPLTASWAPVLLDTSGKELDPDNMSNNNVNRGDLKNFEKVYSGLDRNKTYNLGYHKMEEHHILEEDKKFTIYLSN